MTDFIRYVNTASTSGGDGTTRATTGANRAYVSLSAAEAAEATDIDTAGDSFEFQCEGSTADTTSVTFGSDWTTSAADNIVVKPHADDVNTSGIYDTGLYRIETSTQYTGCLRCTSTSVYHIEFNGLQMSVGTSQQSCIFFDSTGSNSVYNVIGCWLKGTGSGTNQEGINLQFGGTSTANLVNNVIYEFGEECIKMNYVTSDQANVYNNTLDSSATTGMSFPSGSSSQRIFNNLITNCTTADYASAGSPTTDNNVTTDTSGPDTGHTEKPIDYTDASGDDYSTSDTDVVGLGTDLSADSEYAVTVDILGVARTGSPDIGAFQHVAAGGIEIFRRRREGC